MADLQRAWAILEVKAVDGRKVTGIASTPNLDRQGHIFEIDGATFANPIPLLLHHDIEKPIGTATLTKRAGAIHFEASLPPVEDPGPLRDRLEDVRQLLTAGLLRGASIGFRILEDGIEFLKGGVIRIVKSEICELSLVTVPANREATILSIKSLDLAAMGLHSPGVAGLPIVSAIKSAPAMTIAEQITQWSNTRAPKVAKMGELMADAAKTGVTLDAKASEEYDGLKAEVQSIDSHLARLRESETLLATHAAPIVPAPIHAPAPVAAAPVPIQVKSMLPPGTAFVRAACAIMCCKGNFSEAAEYAKGRWDKETPEVALYLKAAVAAGNTTDATWASPLAQPANIAADFIELLRPATIMGKIPNWRKVPFNVKVPAQTAGGTYGWVGEAKPKPVTKLAFAAQTLPIAKAAGIVVLTEELVRISSPSAEALVRADMIAGIAQFLDAQLIDPAVAAVAGVNPASITNGAGTAAGTADPLQDVLTIFKTFAAANIPISGAALIMSEANALALSFRRNAVGDRLFGDMTPSGGTIDGINVVASNAAGTNVIGVQPQYVLMADEGGVNIDVSREASLQMDSAPMSPADATVVMVSLWQNNLVGLRAERFVNWLRITVPAVYYLTAANYAAPSGAPLEAAPESPSAARGRKAGE